MKQSNQIIKKGRFFGLAQPQFSLNEHIFSISHQLYSWNTLSEICNCVCVINWKAMLTSVGHNGMACGALATCMISSGAATRPGIFSTFVQAKAIVVAETGLFRMNTHTRAKTCAHELFHLARQRFLVQTYITVNSETATQSSCEVCTQMWTLFRMSQAISNYSFRTQASTVSLLWLYYKTTWLYEIL